jgi:hypothetical protein
VNAETESLVCYLDEQRDSMLQIVDGLPEAALRRAVFPSGWTCLGLARHLAVDDERNWFRGVAAGEPVDFPAGEDPGWLAGRAGSRGRGGVRPLPWGDRPDAIIVATKGMTWIP